MLFRKPSCSLLLPLEFFSVMLFMALFYRKRYWMGGGIHSLVAPNWFVYFQGMALSVVYFWKLYLKKKSSFLKGTTWKNFLACHKNFYESKSSISSKRNSLRTAYNEKMKNNKVSSPVISLICLKELKSHWCLQN